MASGTVRRFDAEKGWGFASADDGGDDVMLHVREMLPGEDPAWLRPGTRVRYEVRRTSKGLRAANIGILSANDPADSGVLSARQFRDEVSAVLADSVARLEEVARRHGWVE